MIVDIYYHISAISARGEMGRKSVVSMVVNGLLASVCITWKRRNKILFPVF